MKETLNPLTLKEVIKLKEEDAQNWDFDSENFQYISLHYAFYIIRQYGWVNRL